MKIQMINRLMIHNHENDYIDNKYYLNTKLLNFKIFLLEKFKINMGFLGLPRVAPVVGSCSDGFC